MSYNQPGPYGGQQPGPYGQQPGPYGAQPPQQPGYGYPQQGPPGVPPQAPQAPYGQPQQPGPYGQQPQAPYGQQPHAPYGQVPPPPPAPRGGGGKKAGLVIGAVAVVAAIAVGAYFVLGGKDGGGSSSVTDDGPHKLVAPASVGEYTKDDASSGSGDGPLGDSDSSAMADMGIKDATNVSAKYKSGTGMESKALNLNGGYGKISDPGKTVDAAFDRMHEKSKDTGDNVGDKEEVTWDGDPESVSPSDLDNAVMKCQSAQVGEGAKVMKFPVCVWADHSTFGLVTATDTAAMMKGAGGPTTDEVAELGAKLRKAARVKA